MKWKEGPGKPKVQGELRTELGTKVISPRKHLLPVIEMANPQASL